MSAPMSGAWTDVCYRYWRTVIGLEHALRVVALEHRVPADDRRHILRQMLAAMPDGPREETVTRLLDLGVRWNRLWESEPDDATACSHELSRVAHAAATVATDAIGVTVAEHTAGRLELGRPAVAS